MRSICYFVLLSLFLYEVGLDSYFELIVELCFVHFVTINYRKVPGFAISAINKLYVCIAEKSWSKILISVFFVEKK